MKRQHFDRYTFRGISVKTNEFIYGDRIRCDKAAVIVPHVSCDEINIEELAIREETLGQCTGIMAEKSYRGEKEADRMIFEGDICLLDCGDYEVKVIVRFGFGCFRVTLIGGKIDAFTNQDVLTHGIDLEIIGTVHTHPELLEDEACQENCILPCL